MELIIQILKSKIKKINNTLLLVLLNVDSNAASVAPTLCIIKRQGLVFNQLTINNKQSYEFAFSC